MLTVSGSQCKRARGLLQWNHRDLSHKAKIPVSRLNNFERGLIHLHQGENKAVYDAFKEEGITFHEFGEVTLDPDMAGKKSKKEVEVHGMGRDTRQDRLIVADEDCRRLLGFDALR